MTLEVFRYDLIKKIGADNFKKVRSAKIGIAGAGGLGSNCAVNLVRVGFEKLTIVDFDRVDAANLDRQFYFLDQVGMDKVEALEKELRNCFAFTRRQAAADLGDILSPRSMLALENALDDADTDVRIQSVRSLVKLHAGSGLSKALKNECRRVREIAAQGLGDLVKEWGPMSVFPLLLPGLEERDSLVRKAVTDAIAKCGPENVEILIRAMDNPNLNVCINAMDAIGKIKDMFFV